MNPMITTEYLENVRLMAEVLLLVGAFGFGFILGTMNEVADE